MKFDGEAVPCGQEHCSVVAVLFTGEIPFLSSKRMQKVQQLQCKLVIVEDKAHS